MISALWLLVPIISFSHGNVFECLDSCKCDTEVKIIFCEDGHRKELALPSENDTLSGYPIIVLRNNEIQNLPDEQTLIRKFPDLKLIQAIENPPFNCSSLEEYTKVKIENDCVHITDLSVSRLPTDAPTENKCQSVWVLLFEYLKSKYEQFDAVKSAEKLRDLTAILADIVSNLAPIIAKITVYFVV